MPIELNCSQCGQLLRVPDSAGGKKAKCPKCQHINTIPAASADDPFAGVGDLSDGGGGPAPSDNPFAGLEQASNPYAAPKPTAPIGPMGKPVAIDGPIQPQVVDVGVIVSYAWEIWKKNLGLLVGATVVVALLTNVPGQIIQFAALNMEQNGDDGAALFVRLLNIPLQLFAIFIGIGQLQIVLNLVRGRPASMGMLFGGGSRFLPTLGGSILFGIACAIGFILCIVPGIIFLLFFWPYYYLIVDGKAGVMDSFSLARRITTGNELSTFVLWLIGFGIIVLGLLALCVGVFLAAPLVMTIFVVAYLMMSGQLAASPKPY